MLKCRVAGETGEETSELSPRKQAHIQEIGVKGIFQSVPTSFFVVKFLKRAHVS